MITISFSPKFDAKAIYLEAVKIPFVRLEAELTMLADTMLAYLQTYINTHSKGEHTGNLANSMKIDYVSQHSGQIPMMGWGIGKISDLEITAPYWRIIDLGGSGFQGEYHFVPGEFSGNKFNYMPGITEGKMLPSGVKGIIKPMHYRDASNLQLDREIQRIITSLKG